MKSASEQPLDQAVPLSRRELGLVCAFWMGYALLSVIGRLFERGVTSQLSNVAAIAFIEALVWIVLTIPIFRLTAGVDSDGRERAIFLIVLTGIAIAIAVGWFGTELRQLLTPFQPNGPPRTADTLRVAAAVRDSLARVRPRGPRGPPIWFGLFNALVLYSGVVAAGVARAYSRRYYQRREEAATREARLEAQLAEARLDALRRQLDPHFLFNTLNAVSALLERDPKGVRRMISRLSELLRYHFEGNDTAEVPLRHELKMLARYIEIMQVRFQGRLTVDTQVDDTVLDSLVPAMILQPLVENAIKHGVEKITDPGVISVIAVRSGSDVLLRISDNGPGPQAGDAGARTGVGLRNSTERLAQLYGSAQHLHLGARVEGGTLVEVRLPYHTAMATSSS